MVIILNYRYGINSLKQYAHSISVKLSQYLETCHNLN